MIHKNRNSSLKTNKWMQLANCIPDKVAVIVSVPSIPMPKTGGVAGGGLREWLGLIVTVFSNSFI